MTKPSEDQLKIEDKPVKQTTRLWYKAQVLNYTRQFNKLGIEFWVEEINVGGILAYDISWFGPDC